MLTLDTQQDLKELAELRDFITEQEWDDLLICKGEIANQHMILSENLDIDVCMDPEGEKIQTIVKSAFGIQHALTNYREMKFELKKKYLNK